MVSMRTKKYDQAEARVDKKPVKGTGLLLVSVAGCQSGASGFPISFQR